MTKTNSRAAHSLFALACIAAPLAACATDAKPSPTDPTTAGPDGAIGLDPTGNWTLTYSFAAGCGQAASQAASTFTVTQGPDGYDVEIAGTTTAGTLTCTAASCRLSAVFTWKDTPGTTSFQQSANITLDAQDNIKGNGTESVMSSTMSCNIGFTVDGARD
jgi:hypothetical protein